MFSFNIFFFCVDKLVIDIYQTFVPLFCLTTETFFTARPT